MFIIIVLYHPSLNTKFMYMSADISLKTGMFYSVDILIFNQMAKQFIINIINNVCTFCHLIPLLYIPNDQLKPREMLVFNNSNVKSFNTNERCITSKGVLCDASDVNPTMSEKNIVTALNDSGSTA